MSVNELRRHENLTGHTGGRPVSGIQSGSLRNTKQHNIWPFVQCQGTRNSSARYLDAVLQPGLWHSTAAQIALRTLSFLTSVSQRFMTVTTTAPLMRQFRAVHILPIFFPKMHFNIIFRLYLCLLRVTDQVYLDLYSRGTQFESSPL